MQRFLIFLRFFYVSLRCLLLPSLSSAAYFRAIHMPTDVAYDGRSFLPLWGSAMEATETVWHSDGSLKSHPYRCVCGFVRERERLAASAENREQDGCTRSWACVADASLSCPQVECRDTMCTQAIECASSPVLWTCFTAFMPARRLALSDRMCFVAFREGFILRPYAGLITN